MKHGYNGRVSKVIDSDICAEVDKIVTRHYLIAEKHFDRILTPVPTIQYNLTGKCAGMANSFTYPFPIIQLNPHFFEENKEEMLHQTVPHEVAHLITDKVYGDKKPHGPEWKSVMRLFGLEPKRCHAYDTSQVILKRKTRCFTYYCRCFSGVTVGLNIHRKIQAYSSHRCRHCKKCLNKCPWEEK